MKQYNKVLTIAGSDSGGGAGVQADIKTISACGCYAASAITAITVQNTLGVSAVHAVPVEILEGQIEAVLSDIGADAIKIGMLHSSDLLPRARVITPNIPEAEILLGGDKLSVQKELPDAAKRLADKCGASVLLKAGHLTEEKLVDIFYDVEDGKIYELPSARIHTKNTHGTGCTLSSAFASIVAGAEYEIGHGFGPVKHFWALWKE